MYNLIIIGCSTRVLQSFTFTVGRCTTINTNFGTTRRMNSNPNKCILDKDTGRIQMRDYLFRVMHFGAKALARACDMISHLGVLMISYYT